MVKAFCVWCESGERTSPSGYFWIHPECANKLMDISGDIKSIKEMLKGEHSRNKLKEEGQNKIDIIYEFIKDMELFKKQWEGSMRLMKGTSHKQRNTRSK